MKHKVSLRQVDFKNASSAFVESNAHMLICHVPRTCPTPNSSRAESVVPPTETVPLTSSGSGNNAKKTS